MATTETVVLNLEAINGFKPLEITHRDHIPLVLLKYALNGVIQDHCISMDMGKRDENGDPVILYVENEGLRALVKQFMSKIKLVLEPISPGRYRHFKGRDYLVIGEAVNSETQEPLVLYVPLYGKYRVVAHPKVMFFEEIDRPEYSYRGPRFRFILDNV